MAPRKWCLVTDGKWRDFRPQRLTAGRYWLTDDGLVIMSSEAGVLDIADDKIIRKWRIQPGKIMLVDLERGRVVDDDEIKRDMTEARPYGEWADETQIPLTALDSQATDNLRQMMRRKCCADNAVLAIRKRTLNLY